MTGINTINVFEQYELPDALDNMFDKMFKSQNIELSKIKYIACETTPLTKYHNISVVHFLQKYGMDKGKLYYFINLVHLLCVQWSYRQSCLNKMNIWLFCVPMIEERELGERF